IAKRALAFRALELMLEDDDRVWTRTGHPSLAPSNYYRADPGKVGWLRRWLGDQAVTEVDVTGNADIATVRRFHEAFPEARLVVGWAGDDGTNAELKALRSICDESELMATK